ncbi:DUF6048 family protein [Aurantibacter sp.]|uniref:DUF6048 family protein n=1 Tax=Aurantibacter sp. TaxID=2807103 RepID=UPI0032672DCD
MLKYFISFCFAFVFALGAAQTESDTLVATPIDSSIVTHKQKYGIRFGVDLSRPITGLIADEYSGIEFVADYRLNYKLYIAGEFGNEKKTKQETLYNFTTSGSYGKLGIDYNTYANWYGEQNSIFVGARYAFSSYSQTVNNYRIYDADRYWNGTEFSLGSEEIKEFDGRTASWLEGVVGIKGELFANIYLGFSARIGFLLSNANRDTNFHDLFIPGFNKVTDGSKFGVGYNYTLTYFLPLYKKTKKPKKVKEKEKPKPKSEE